MSEALARATKDFAFPPRVTEAALAAVAECEDAWRTRHDNALAVTAKVVAAFARAGLTDADLAGSVGYGYDDRGREKYEALFADLMGAPAALARLALVSGTHAIVAAIGALAGPSGTLVSLTGRPYDTLALALVDHPGSLTKRGLAYFETPWTSGAQPAAADVIATLAQSPDVVFIQRSRGYAPRPSLSIAQIGALVDLVREHSRESLVVVDNCYGEFVELDEPGHVGADAIIGSLIKNPGGGLSQAGAYIAGTADVIERIAARIFSVGLSSAVGPTLGTLRWNFAGLHRAPKAVAESLKILDFAAALFARLGYDVSPQAGAPRADVIQAIRLGDPDKLCAFCAGLQKLLPVNSSATPLPGPVPGYADPVVMGMGSFVSGSTMELSCDAPLREPFEVYVQGGMDLAHGMLATMSAAAAIIEK